MPETSHSTSTSISQTREETTMTTTIKVSYCNGVSIQVRVLGPTNYRGTRLRVWRGDCAYRDDEYGWTLPWDDALNGSDNAVAAVRHYLANVDQRYADSWLLRSWHVAGLGNDGWVAVPS